MQLALVVMAYSGMHVDTDAVEVTDGADELVLHSFGDAVSLSNREAVWDDNREVGFELVSEPASTGHLDGQHSVGASGHSFTNDWLAEEYLRASAAIDADQAAVAEMLAIQDAAVTR